MIKSVKRFRGTRLFTLLLISIFIWAEASAQVVVSPREVSPVQFRQDRIWNINLVNNSTSSENVILQVTIATDQFIPVLKAIAEPWVLNPGMSVINGNTIKVSRYEYGENRFGELLQRTGTLPYGKYTICYNVLKETNTQELGSYCLEYGANPVSPPFLMTPFRGEVIVTHLPLLTWTPPSPSVSGITYDLRLVELMTDQGPLDAYRRNQPVFELQDIKTNVLQYPVNAYRLVEGRSYAWQVAAKSEGYYLGETEVWHFTYQKEAPEQLSTHRDAVYGIPAKTIDAGFYLATRKLFFKYDEYYSGGTLKYAIRDSRGEDVTPLRKQLFQSYGNNQFSIDLSEAGYFKEDQLYVLEIESQKGDTYFLKFKYRSE